jgi:hypothetical protein
VGTDRLAGPNEWSISPYPDGHRFAFTIVHDADSAYSRRLVPLLEVFDALGLRITVTAFAFWAEWARNGDIWRRLRSGDAEREFWAPKAVPLVDEIEREFYTRVTERGHEVGLHTPSDTSDTRADLERAFEFFGDVFGRYPPVYTEHSCSSNKETQANEGSNPTSLYYSTDLLNRYGPWVWVDGPGGLPDAAHPDFYDLRAAHGSPFNELARTRYGIVKGFVRSGKWRESNGDGFLSWYSEDHIEQLDRRGGLALVYTHLDAKWLDPRTRKMREPIAERLAHLAARNGWFAPAGRILDRMASMTHLRVVADARMLRVVNGGTEDVDGVTLVSPHARRLSRRNERLTLDGHGAVVVGIVRAGETLEFEILG